SATEFAKANNGTCDPTVASTLGRGLQSGSASVNLIAPGTLYGARVNQVDVRLGKLFKMDRYRMQVSADVFNAFNSSAILSQSNTYGTNWQSPSSIIQGRLLKISAQLSF